MASSNASAAVAPPSVSYAYSLHDYSLLSRTTSSRHFLFFQKTGGRSSVVSSDAVRQSAAVRAPVDVSVVDDYDDYLAGGITDQPASQTVGTAIGTWTGTERGSIH